MMLFCRWGRSDKKHFLFCYKFFFLLPDMIVKTTHNKVFADAKGKDLFDLPPSGNGLYVKKYIHYHMSAAITTLAVQNLLNEIETLLRNSIKNGVL